MIAMQNVKRLDVVSNLLGLIGVVVAISTGIAAFDFGKGIGKQKPIVEMQLQQEATTKELRGELMKLKEGIAALEKTMNADVTSDASKVSRQLQRNSAVVSDVHDRLQKLEKAILISPSKALEIPLLQRDIETLKSSHATSAAAMKESVDRIYDQNKWLLGGVSISILALALSNFLRGKASKE